MLAQGEAWYLYRGEGAESATRGQLVRGSLVVDSLRDDEVLVEPLFGCWEGNMGHAIERRPLDLCHHRNEPRVVIGNAGVMRVLKLGSNVSTLKEGDCAILFGSTVIDRYGYPKQMFGYDAPGTIGCFATKTKLSERELIKVPENSKYSLEQWAAFSVRYITAWANWRLAYGTYRISIAKEECPHPNVFGWGGGTTLAELDLARRFGCKSFMLSGNPERLASIARANIEPVDRRPFGDLNFDERRFVTDPIYRKSYIKAETAFLQAIATLTSGEMVQIFVDHIGSSVFRCTHKSLSRDSVITTAGWKTGMTVSFLRAMECIDRHQHIHTHYARYQEGVDAVEFGEREGWMPEVDERIYSYDEIPEMAEDYLNDKLGFFPVYAVNKP